MHGSVLDYVTRQIAGRCLSDKKTLDLGALDVNGTIRNLFTGYYVGVDMIGGHNVDVVANGHNLPFADASFDVVVCMEMFEHDDEFWRSLAEIGRVLRDGGWFIYTTRGNGFGYHGWPHDYYRFMPDAAPKLLKLASCDVVHSKSVESEMDIMGVGVRQAR